MRAGKIHKAKANEWAEKRRGLLVELIGAGLSLNAIAVELTARGITTPRGGQWTATAVRRLRQRLGLNETVTNHRLAA